MKAPSQFFAAGAGAVFLTLLQLTPADAACTENLAADGYLNIRSGPATSDPTLGTIPADTCGVVVRRCEDGWCRVRYDGVRGWASAFYLNRDSDASRPGRGDERDEETLVERWLDVAGDIFAELASDPDWQRIGTLEVDSRREEHVIQLDRRDGRFDALRMRARGADIDFERIDIVYGNGRRQRLDWSRTLYENNESGVIPLAGRYGRFIDRLVLITSKARGRRGPNAEIDVWGRQTADGDRVARDDRGRGNRDSGWDERERRDWNRGARGDRQDRDSRGRPNFAELGPRWQLVGVKSAERDRDRDVIEFDRGDGRFTNLRVRVRRAPVRMHNLSVVYENSERDRIDVPRRLDPNEESRLVTLNGARGRFIDRAVLVHESIGRNGPRAEVELWGETAAGPPRRGPDPDPDRGFSRLEGDWQLLGTRLAERGWDNDVISFDPIARSYSAIGLIARDAPIAIHRLNVRYRNGGAESVEAPQRLRPGEPSEALDLRGRHGRKLERLLITHESMGGENRLGRVEIWGRLDDRPDRRAGNRVR